MNKFIYLDYKTLLIDQLKEEKKQRGTLSKLAKFIDVHTTFLTHVLKGHSHLSVEQALKVCSFFLFSELETDFFVNLVQFNRAGNQQAKKYFLNKMELLKNKSLPIKEHLKKETTLSLEEQAIFYSDWSYSAVRLCTALEEGANVEEIAKILNIPNEKVRKIVEFLIKANLCKFENGRLTYNVFSTYIDSESPFLKKMHDNWRIRSVSFGSHRPEDLMYTSVVTLTKEDFLVIRDMILTAIKKFDKITDESDAKQLAYLCVDWIQLNPN